MDSINRLRALLVAGAVIAAGFAAVAGEWLVVAIMLVAVVVHGFLWVYLARLKQP